MRILAAVLSLVEAIALFALLFAVADSGSLGAALAVMACTVLLCIVSLRLVGIETFRWLSECAAVGLFVACSAVAVLVVLTR